LAAILILRSTVAARDAQVALEFCEGCVYSTGKLPKGDAATSAATASDETTVATVGGNYRPSVAYDSAAEPYLNRAASTAATAAR
jgi:hypothetical protein